MKFLHQNGIIVPAQLANLPQEIGFGCPKCDLAVFVPTHQAEGSFAIRDFLVKHADCGDLEALEKKHGRVMVKGIKQA